VYKDGKRDDGRRDKDGKGKERKKGFSVGVAIEEKRRAPPPVGHEFGFGLIEESCLLVGRLGGHRD